MTSIVVEIFKTKDYDQFKKMKGQRPLNYKKVEALMRAIDVNVGNIQPILVYSDMTVWDGQHRLEACKRLGAPVEYKVTENNVNNAVVINNTATKWRTLDYLNYSMHNTLDKEDADIVRVLLNKVSYYESKGMPQQSVLRFIAGGTIAKVTQFSINIADNLSINMIDDKCYMLNILVETISNITSVKAIKLMKSSMFLGILNVLYFNSKFDFKLLASKIITNEDKMYVCSTSDSCIELIEHIYNYRSRAKLDISSWYKFNKSKTKKLKNEKIKQLA